MAMISFMKTSDHHNDEDEDDVPLFTFSLQGLERLLQLLLRDLLQVRQLLNLRRSRIRIKDSRL